MPDPSSASKRKRAEEPEAATPTKRPRSEPTVARDEYHFEAHVANVESFRAVLRNMQGILPTFTMTFSAAGVSIDQINPQKVVLLQAFIDLPVFIRASAPPKTSWCVTFKASDLITRLGLVNPGEVVRLCLLDDHKSLVMESMQDGFHDQALPEPFRSSAKSIIPLLEHEDPFSMDVENMRVTAQMQLDTRLMKPILSNLAHIAQNVLFRVSKNEDAVQGGTLHEFVVAAENPRDFQRKFTSVTLHTTLGGEARDADGPIVVTNAPMEAVEIVEGAALRMQPVFEGLFNIEFINRIFKNIEQPTITLKFTSGDSGEPDDAGPLIVKYSLGGKAYIRWILAPTNK
jgi:hypothetical protein